MSEAVEDFEEALRFYLHANNYEPEVLRDDIASEPDSPKNRRIRDGLRETMDEGLITPRRFNELTGRLFVSQGDVDDWLALLWDYLFEDGPDLPTDDVGYDDWDDDDDD